MKILILLPVQPKIIKYNSKSFLSIIFVWVLLPLPHLFLVLPWYLASHEVPRLRKKWTGSQYSLTQNYTQKFDTTWARDQCISCLIPALCWLDTKAELSIMCTQHRWTWHTITIHDWGTLKQFSILTKDHSRKKKECHTAVLACSKSQSVNVGAQRCPLQ